MHFRRLVADFGVIQDAASFAINDAKLAAEPETYARTVKGMAGYSPTVLPPDLPKRVDGSNIKVPDFSTVTDWNAMNALTANNKLTLHYVSASVSPGYHFLSQDPPRVHLLRPGPQSESLVMANRDGRC